MKKILLVAIFAVALSGMFTACSDKKQDDLDWVKNAIHRADFQLRETAVKFDADTIFPRSIKNGEYKLVGAKDWTSGFFPGSLWLQYELTGDKFFEQQAISYTSKLDGIQFYTGTHDLGFMVFCSYGNQYMNMHDDASAQTIIDASKSLITRQRPEIGLIRSWDFGEWNYPVIVDNMMNLEMLFWASKQTNDPIYKDAALLHADLTLKNQFRDDFSSYHVVSYNDDGTVQSQGTFQGFSDSSAWARGQAWGLYGYTMCYRETKLERYLEQAERIAAFIMGHPNTPEDLIPYWDYNAPDIPSAPRDASAAAIYSSALFELSTLTEGETSKKYFEYAEKLLKNLSSDAYLAPEGGNGGFIIMHCVGHLPANSEIDTPLNYADYYYLEAIKRYLNIKGLLPSDLTKAEKKKI